ncbi:ankyrin repeat domain-containing protein [Verrucomicrobiota bacterium]
MNKSILYRICVIVTVALVTSCVGWYPRFNAKHFYSDPRVIELCEGIKRNDRARVERALASGADLHASGRDGMTPLCWTFYRQKKDMFKLLLEKGADPNFHMVTEHRGTASVLEFAIFLGMTEYVDFMLQYTVDLDLNIPNATYFNRTPIYQAISSSEIEIEMVSKFLEYGADLEWSDEIGLTPLLYAVRHGKYEIALLLIDRGADLNAVTTRRRLTVVDLLEKDTVGHTSRKYPQKLAFARFLIVQGMSVDLEIIKEGWDITWEKKNGKWKRK